VANDGNKLTVVIVHHLGPKLKAAEYDPGGLGHGRPRSGDVGIKAVEWSADQEGIMHGGADFDPAFRGQASGKTHHLGAISLHREITQ
jgi:hypothetical protein